MKKYNCKKRISKQARQAIKNAINQHEIYKRAYFWKPGFSASDRRRNEARFKIKHPEFDAITEMGIVEVRVSYSESCKNVYYSMNVYVDGKMKDVRVLKNIMKYNY